MTAECQSCGAPTDGAICHREAERLTGRMRGAAWIWGALGIDLTVTRQARVGDPTPRAGRPAPPEPIRPDGGRMRHYADQSTGWADGLPYAEGPSDVAWGVANTVTTWARAVVEATGADPPTGMGELMVWLADRLTWVRHQTWALQCFDELDDATAQLWRAIDRPAGRRYLGPCECGVDLYARGRPATVECSGCGTVWDVCVRERWLAEQVRARCYAAVEIEEAYGIRADRIRQWASRGRIVARGTDRRGRALYALPEVLAMARRAA